MHTSFTSECRRRKNTSLFSDSWRDDGQAFPIPGSSKCLDLSRFLRCVNLVGLDPRVHLLCRKMTGVGSVDWFRYPLPPNRTCGSPASGSPVGGLTCERTGMRRYRLAPS